VRIVILTNPRGNQLALVNKLSRVADIAAVVLSENIPRKKPRILSRIKLASNAAAGRLFAKEFRHVWIDVRAKYASSAAAIPTEDIVNVRNVNDEATLETIRKVRPDLVLVSGTNIVGKRVIEAAQESGGVLNLHTGISPYVKGGPNCTNWCLARGWFHLIGNTVMWLDKGVDTGNIISTEQTPLDGSETLLDLHWKVMEHAHDLYVRTIEHIGRGKPVPAVKQSEIAKGVEFRGVDWTCFEMRRALKNFRTRYRPYFADRARFDEDSRSISLVSLNGQSSQ
jgi:methionyl-tRNA formyltransferase